MGLGSAVVEHPPMVLEVLHGFDSWGRVIPKALKMVVVASLLGAQGLRISITTDSSVSV